MLDKYYDELVVGAVELGERRTVTEAHAVGFAGITALAEPPDDPIAADLVSPARALFAMSLLTGLVPALPGRALGIVGLLDVRFLAPVQAGDTVQSRFEVVAKRPKPPGGVVEMREELLDQAGRVLFHASMHVWVAASDVAEPRD